MRFLSGVLAAAATVGFGANALNGTQQRALDIHNDARSDHGLSPLTWDDGLAATAQGHANHLAQVGQLQPNSSGENLYSQSGASYDVFASAAQTWVDEAPNYHGQAIPDGDFETYGHYTQVVWHSTQRVGMAAATASDGSQYVAAMYDPAGNVVGQTPY